MMLTEAISDCFNLLVIYLGVSVLTSISFKIIYLYSGDIAELIFLILVFIFAVTNLEQAGLLIFLPL